MSYLSTRIHLIWSTARREPRILPDWQPRLHQYMGGILDNHGAKILAIGGVADHIHLYTAFPATLALAQLVSAVKTNSSAWLHETLDRSFAWQEGYAAFTMSKSADADVIRYIQNQEPHHHRQSFQEELIAFLEKYQIPYDPRYVHL